MRPNFKKWLRKPLNGLKQVVFKPLLRHFFQPLYWFASLRHALKSRFGMVSEPQYDLIFVVARDTQGWILEAICREISQHFQGRCGFAYSLYSLPPAKAYFFSHYSLFINCLRFNSRIHGAQNLVFHTHPRDIGISERELTYALNRASKVICMNSTYAQGLISQGVSTDIVTYVIGAADPEFFRPHERGNGAVGFCMAYYPRKSPDLIVEIIQRMPHRRFILLGKRWNQYERFERMMQLPNLTYIETSYARYPEVYAQMDVFVSPAKLEGGPIPLIETMMANVVPVASRTGFAPDLVVHGENGFLFDVDSSAEAVCALIDQAFELKTNIRATAEHLSWKHYAQQIQGLLNAPLSTEGQPAAVTSL